MYLQTDKIVATIGNIVMRSYPTPNPQYLLDPTAVVGWADGVDARRTTTPRVISDGDFPEKGYHASRYISFTGTAIADDATSLHKMRDDLIGAIKPEVLTQMSFEDITGLRFANVTLAAKVSWVQQTDTFAIFKVDLYAPDPKIYGPVRKFSLPARGAGGGLKYGLKFPLSYNVPKDGQPLYISNAGNVLSWPIFVVTGDYPSGFSITDNAGNYITYGGPVTMTDPVILSSATGSATQGGNDRSTMLKQRQWFPIKPNTTIQPTFIPYAFSTGWCDILFTDTWV